MRLIAEEAIAEDMRMGGGVVTDMRCAWRQSLGEQLGSRLAGMLSQLNAAVLSGERGGGIELNRERACLNNREEGASLE